MMYVFNIIYIYAYIYIGSGWQDWCKQMFGEEIVPDKAPWGSGFNGHARLPISVRLYDASMKPL